MASTSLVGRGCRCRRGPNKNHSASQGVDAQDHPEQAQIESTCDPSVPNIHEFDVLKGLLQVNEASRDLLVLRHTELIVEALDPDSHL